MKKSRSFLFCALLWCLSFCLPVWSPAQQPTNEAFQAHFEQEDLDVNLCWPTRSGNLYRVESSENLTDFTPTNIVRYGNGGMQRVHVYSFPPPVPPVPDPNAPPPDLRPIDLLYFTVNPFLPAQTAPFGYQDGATLFTWHQRATADEPAQVCRVLYPINFAEVPVGNTGTTARFPTFFFYYNVDVGNTHKLHYDFSTWASPFQQSYLSHGEEDLSPNAAAVFNRLKDQLPTILSRASEQLAAQATAQVPEPVPYVPGQRKFYRVIETRLDTDGDGLFDDEEMGEHNTDPYTYDTDGDGYSDGHEIDSGSDPGNAADTPISGGPGTGGGGSDAGLPGEQDLDGDGLSNEEETRLGTNPRKKDTDGDGAWDGTELHPTENLLTYARGMSGSYADIEVGEGTLVDICNEGKVLCSQSDGFDAEGKPLFKYWLWNPAEPQPQTQLLSKLGTDVKARLSYSQVADGGTVFGTGLRKSAHSNAYYSQAFKKPLNGNLEWLVGDNAPDEAPPAIPDINPPDSGGDELSYGKYNAAVLGVDRHGSVYAQEWRTGVEGNIPLGFTPKAVLVHNSLTVWGTAAGPYGAIESYFLAPSGDAQAGKQVRQGRLDALSPEGRSVSYQERVNWVTTVRSTLSAHPAYAGGKHISVETKSPAKVLGFYYRKNTSSTVSDDVPDNSAIISLPPDGDPKNTKIKTISDMAKEDPGSTGRAYMNGPIAGGSYDHYAAFWAFNKGKWKRGSVKAVESEAGPPTVPRFGHVRFIEDDGDFWLDEGDANWIHWNGREYTPFTTILDRNGVAGGSDYQPKKTTSKGLIGCQKGTMTRLLLPAEVVSRDKYMAGSFVIPEGWDSLEMEFVGPTENLGKYGSLLGGGTTKVYDRVQDIFNEADMAEGGQSAAQKVWFVKESTNPRKINFYTCFNAVGDVQIKLYLNGGTTANGSIAHTLIAASDFASTIAYVDAWVKGTSFQWAESAPPPPPVLGAPLAATQPVGASNPPEEGIDNFTRGCLIPFFTVINQVEGFAAIAHGLFEGVKNGLQDDWKMILFIKEGAVLAGNWAWQQIELEILEWRTDPLKRVGELKQLADRLCEEFIFKPLKELADDLSTWEGFKDRAWRVWEAIKGVAQTAWSVTKSVWNSVVDGLTDWSDDFCNRMMQGAEKTHWAGVPWAKDKLLNDINTTTREISYTFGYSIGYLGEQVAVGVVTSGAVKIAQVMAKGGLHLALSLAKRSTATVVARAHWLKHLLAEAGAGDALFRAAYERGLVKCAVEPVGPTIKDVIFEVLEKAFSKEGFDRSIYSLKHLQDDILQRPNLSKLLKQQGGEVIFQRRLSQLAKLLGDDFDAVGAKNFAKVMDEKLIVTHADDSVSEWGEDFFRAFKGNPALFVNREPIDALSDGAKQRLKNFLAEPFPGYIWKFEEEITDNWKEPIVRGILVELDMFYKGGLKEAGWTHLPTREAVDLLDPSVIAKQVKSLGTVNSGTLANMKQALNDLGDYSDSGRTTLILEIKHRPSIATDVANLKSQLESHANTDVRPLLPTGTTLKIETSPYEFIPKP